MVAAVKRSAPAFKVNSWVRIEGGYGGIHNGKAAKIVRVRRNEAVQVALDSGEAWFEYRYVRPISQAEAISQPTTAQTEVVTESKPDSEPVLAAHKPEVVSEFSHGAIAPTQNLNSEVLEAEFIPELFDLESQIEEGRRLVETGEQSIWSAIALIRQQALWKTAPTPYKSFEDYCWRRWEWQKSNAHEVASAGEVVLSLRSSGLAEEAMPVSITQIRPLKRLPETQRSEALKLAYATHGKLTADGIKAAVEQLQPAADTAPESVTPEFNFTPLSEPKPVWFRVGDSWTEGEAIAQNQRGMIRIRWDSHRETDVPGDRVQWSKPPAREATPTTQIAPETRAGLAAAGLAICTPSITPTEFNREMWGDENGICKSFTTSTQQQNVSIKPPNIDISPEPEAPILRLKVKRGKKGLEILSAIVQHNGITHYLKLDDIQLEE